MKRGQDQALVARWLTARVSDSSQPPLARPDSLLAVFPAALQGVCQDS